jgi:hypothetical protein
VREEVEEFPFDRVGQREYEDTESEDFGGEEEESQGVAEGSIGSGDGRGRSKLTRWSCWTREVVVVDGKKSVAADDVDQRGPPCSLTTNSIVVRLQMES